MALLSLLTSLIMPVRTIFCIQRDNSPSFRAAPWFTGALTTVDAPPRFLNFSISALRRAASFSFVDMGLAGAFLELDGDGPAVIGLRFDLGLGAATESTLMLRLLRDFASNDDELALAPGERKRGDPLPFEVLSTLTLRFADATEPPEAARRGGRVTDGGRRSTDAPRGDKGWSILGSKRRLNTENAEGEKSE